MEERSGKGLGAHIDGGIVVDVAAVKRDCTAVDVKTTALTYMRAAVTQARSLPGS